MSVFMPPGALGFYLWQVVRQDDHGIRVEAFRRWREAALREVMHEDMMLNHQSMNGHGFTCDDVETEKPRSLEYES